VKGLRFVMGQDYSADSDHGFLTPWSVVLEAMQSRAPGAPEALAKLYTLYWPALYGFARRKGHPREDAEDLVQGFFEHLIGSRGLATVDRSKGKFRSFLFVSFKNFTFAEIRRAKAQKHGGGAELLRLDWEDAEDRIAFEPSDQITPEMLFDAQWALLLLNRVTRQLEQEQAAAGKAESFRTLKSFLGGEAGSRTNPTYEEAARILGLSVSTVTSRIHQLRRRHAKLVREEVARTVLDPTQIETELHELCEALVQAEGRAPIPGRTA
jgi:RNA polymerase sigma factor (sigma-70 family)